MHGPAISAQVWVICVLNVNHQRVLYTEQAARKTGFPCTGWSIQNKHLITFQRIVVLLLPFLDSIGQWLEGLLRCVYQSPSSLFSLLYDSASSAATSASTHCFLRSYPSRNWAPKLKYCWCVSLCRFQGALHTCKKTGYQK